MLDLLPPVNTEKLPSNKRPLFPSDHPNEATLSIRTARDKTAMNIIKLSMTQPRIYIIMPKLVSAIRGEPKFPSLAVKASSGNKWKEMDKMNESGISLPMVTPMKDKQQKGRWSTWK